MKILILEDNKDFADLIRYTYHEEDFFLFDSLYRGLEWLNTNKPDLILVDLGLTDSHGIDTLRALSGINFPKIVVTGRSDVAWEAAELGAADYVLKNSDGGSEEVLARIGFNIEKYRLKPKIRFAPDVFEEIKACFAFSHDKLTTAH